MALNLSLFMVHLATLFEDCLYFELGNRSTTGCNESSFVGWREAGKMLVTSKCSKGQRVFMCSRSLKIFIDVVAWIIFVIFMFHVEKSLYTQFSDAPFDESNVGADQ